GISGPASSVDHFPLVVDDNELNSPTIAHRYGASIELLSEIKWVVWGKEGISTIYRNGDAISNRTWSGCGITVVAVEGFLATNYTILIIDSEGNKESSTVIVTEYTTQNGINILRAIVASGLIATVLLFDRRRRNKLPDDNTT
ncbi:MAG: hypothetical protein ACFFF4_11885, partial [Candidatus Thorarchaeota archaeon]